ncbi:hypothetical protein CROQUDRAFT_233492 [Cronartium quercuum f. sp. fusiforme G11]|uniref:PIN domain-containing protein n=1 Tax=Cronartium quercuum f. sp. fusiforme G11 TaxID=708437 RepID=A0A9P6NED7_9BASI|nr:hypothetical protein CROQUDRAFT_233492 [Cronartium quercuum f. sp. fusiforme G11]
MTSTFPLTHPSPSHQTLPQSSTESPSPKKLPSSASSRPKDGARTLVDAVTAYQRRNARPRAERTPVQDRPHSSPTSPSSNQPPPSITNTSQIHQPEPIPDQSSPNPPERQQRPGPSSGRNRNQHDAGFSRRLHVTRESPSKPNKPSDSRGSRSFGTGFKVSQKNGIQNIGGMVGVRSTSTHPSASASQVSKLYDPNASPQPQSRVFTDNARVPAPSPSASRREPGRSELTTIAGVISTKVVSKPTDDREPTHSSRPHPITPLKKSALAMDADLNGHERWKSSKKAIRGEHSNTTGVNGLPRQLFDPRKHDPVKFSAAKRVLETASGPTPSHSDVREPGKVTNGPGLAPASLEEADQDGQGASSHERRKPPSIVVQLKRAYKHIIRLETALKDEEVASKFKDEEIKTRELREGTSSTTNGFLRIDARQKAIEDEYWVKLAKQHRDLAEAHHQFLEMATDPKLPASMHALPQKYNIPTRLWQTGFHQLLERLRHALPSSSVHSTSQHLLEHMTDFIYFAYGFYTNLLEEQSLGTFKSVWIEQLGDLARYRMAVAGLMTKLTSHPQLPHPVSLQRANSETDLSDDDEPDQVLVGRRKRRGRRRKQGSQSDDAHSITAESLDLGSESEETDSRLSAFPEPTPAQPPPPSPVKICGSIGVAALGDWEFEEQEIWRATAKDWYSKGLAENPGTGRLHHHLALLSKGDELRTLYHYAKSLTASRPYLPARESVLPFFESEHQARRTRPEVSITDLFVHLHGMLFTKIQLDDFEHELARFMEKLAEDRLISQRDGQTAKTSMSDANWVMMATINICALLQYGAEDGLIRVGQSQLRQKAGTEARNRSSGSKAGGVSKMTAPMPKSLMVAPQAILLNNHASHAAPTESLGHCRPSQSMSSEDGLVASSVDQQSDVLSHEEPMDSEDRRRPTSSRLEAAESHDEEAGPIVLTLAAKLGFEMLADALQSQLTRLCPYVTLMITFLGSMSQDEQVMAKLERFIPWMKLGELFNTIPPAIELDVAGHESFKLLGNSLPEDWCLRGMEWTSKGVFGRGHWKPSKVQSDAHSWPQPVPESEMDVLSSFAVGVRSERSHAQPIMTDANRQPAYHQHRINKDEQTNEEEKKAVSDPACDARWKRIGLIAVSLSRSVTGISFDPNVAGPGRFVVLPSLRKKISIWETQARREREEQRLLKTKRTGRERAMVEIDEEIDNRLEYEEEEEEDEDRDGGDNELVRSLKARRRELRAILNQIKNPVKSPASNVNPNVNVATKAPSARTTKNLSAKPQARVNALPGYTVLVLDTNILIGMLSIVKDLLESERWTIVIPLVVITELDGLKKASGQMGKARLSEDAVEAIKYLECSIKTKARWLKIQTSKGNYLRDLWIRNEELDFAAPDPSTQACSTDHARNLDDLVLRAAIWQIGHFATTPPVGLEPEPEKVVLVTLDRNLRLKARARGMVAADEKQIIGLVESSTEKEHGSRPVG